MTRIYITGTVGSGKTSLAKKLSKYLKIPFYELDNIVWKYSFNGDIRRNEKEIKSLFNKILNKDNWIIENVGKKYFDDGFKYADKIIYLKISKNVIYKRIIFRWIKQNLKIENCRYKPSFKMLFKMLAWANKDINSDKYKMLNKYKNKLIILTEKEVNKNKYIEL